MKHARDDYNRIQDPAGKIPEDEPVFLLRAQDPAAADTVRFWASRVEHLAEVAGKPVPDIVKVAREQADRMDEWEPKKELPDL